ncbi:MAG: cupredoxin domain-containing protein [Acidimicrobiales bacterium]
MRRFLPAFVVAAFVATALLTGGLVATAGGGARSEAETLGPGPVTVTLNVEHTRFSQDKVVVRPGTEVRFVVVNDDPIDHELIVGPQQVHDVHEAGSHAQHPPIPGEVSVGPNAEAETTYRFDQPGDVVFACHLPGHFAYGMHGVVEVVTR